MVTSQRQTSQQDAMRQRAGFPVVRPRRLRLNATIRGMLRETSLAPSDFIYPLFVRHGENIKQPIASMPGQQQWSVDRLRDEAREIAALGIPAVVLFGIPDQQRRTAAAKTTTPTASSRRRSAPSKTPRRSWSSSPICASANTPTTATAASSTCRASITSRLPDGYCSTTRRSNCWPQHRWSHAEAGADIIAPSGMMDGMVGAIRAALDDAGLRPRRRS